MGALGVVSAGLISTGLWYDSHRNALAVERAREQVSAAQTADASPEPVAVTTSEPADEGAPGDSTETSVESPDTPVGDGPATDAGTAETGSSTAGTAQVSVPTTAAAAAAVAPRRSAQSSPPAPVAERATPSTGGGATETATGDATTEPTEQQITQPVDPAPAPGGVLPGLIDLVRPFLPQPDAVPQAPAVQQAPAAEVGAGAADEDPGLTP
ncbi:hypothetical protein [Dietzia sp. JS16-p6b]|uniref:hypothetical protein n=1 Tax=Dietzia sp. JS16-p6b TaxID=2052657 RepID=UPI00131F0A30|nr:hypothetical protein [Dietzia sp. JS16-p6b]